MPDLKLLTDELEQTIKLRNDLREKHKGASIMPEDARAEDAQLTERGKKLHVAIEQEKQAQRDREFDNLGSYMNDPQHYVSRGAINADDEGRKTMQERGWIFEDGVVYRNTIAGVKVLMWGEEVINGPIPTGSKDADVAEYMKQVRHIIQPVYRQAFNKFLGISSRSETAMAWQQLSSEEQKALSEGNDSAGGFLVPPDMQAEMLARTAQKSVFRRLARTVNTSRDKIVFPRVEPAAATESGVAAGGGSIFSSAFVGGWVGETPAFSEKDPKFGTFEINIRKLRVATKLSNDFIADAVVNVPSWLAQNGAENMALVEDQGFITGDGGALQPLGILNDPGLLTVDVEGPTANTISNATGAGSSDKLIKNQVYGLPAQYADNAVWLMRRAVEGKIRVLADSTGRYLWPLHAGSAFGLPNGVGARSLMEYPVNNSDFMPDDGADTNKVTIFGDLSAYIIAQRAQISVQILRERFADVDQTGIIIFERLGGALWNPDAIRCGVV